MYRLEPYDSGPGFPWLIAKDNHPGNLEEVSSWFLGNRSKLEDQLRHHGALLFRGFDIDSAERLQGFIDRIGGGALDYVDGNSPRTKMEGGVYTSTEYPPDQTITMHNELSYSRQWPKYLFFCCHTAPLDGGQTPLTDGRHLLRCLDAELVDQFREKGVCYIRNLHGGRGLGPSWMDTFETEDRDEVEAACADDQTEYEWQKDGSLRIIQTRDAVIRHPETGDEVWFNQADQFHPIQLGEELYESMRIIYKGRDDAFPINCRFGDGTPIDEDMVRTIKETALNEAALFSWQKGDLLMIDNVLTMHGRKPFSGPRKILVSMT